MHTFWSLALFAAIFFVGNTPVRSAPQENARPQEQLVPEEGAVQVMLLRQKAVQECLNLTDREAQKIQEFTSEQWKKAQQVIDLGRDERRQKFTAMTQENDRFIDEILKPEQRKRLDQITLQVAGLLWVTRPTVASKLDLTEEQKTRAHQMQQEARKEMQEYIHTYNKEDRKEKLQQLRQTSRKRLMDLLTDEQEKKWKEMTGDPFLGEFVIENAEKNSLDTRDR